MALTVDIFRHMQAVEKASWHGKASDRPLSSLGHEQARALAEALAAEPIDALYRSPAVRCGQTLAPLAERLGTEPIPLRHLAKNVSRLPEGWEKRSGSNGHRGAYAAGSLFYAIKRVRSEHPEGRVVVCGHLRTITALTAFLAAAHELVAPPELALHGQWYRLRVADDSLAADLIEVPDFPR